MKAVATFHQPTSVIDSLKTTLTDDEDVEHLVIAKASIIEVFAVLPDALRLQCSIEIWGRITSLQAVPTEDTAEHHLLISTDHPDPRLLLLEYVQDSENSKYQLNCVKCLSLHERSARPAEFVNGCQVDHKGKVAVVSSYVGKLKFVGLKDGLIHDQTSFDVSVRELNIVSMCFLLTANSRATVLAILHRDHQQRLVLASHDLSNQELSSSPSAFLSDVIIADTESSLIIPIPPHTRSSWRNHGGVLVLGGSRISFYSIDRRQKKKNADTSVQNGVNSKVAKVETNWPYSEITAWSRVDSEGMRYLLGDAFGRLSLLVFDLEKQKIDRLDLGEISSPTSLTPLSSRYIFVGSHFGDSQLIRIVPDQSTPSGTFVDVAETYKNIAPIMDAVLADIDNSGQPSIVTCSGGRNSGSLRIIRNGANFTADAHVDGIPNVTRIWPLKVYHTDERHYFLLVTTNVSTHLLGLPSSKQGTSITRSNEFVGLRHDSRTLAAGNVLNRKISPTGHSIYESASYMVQVTPGAVVLINTSFGVSEDIWAPERGREIVLADVSPSQICIALSGGLVILLNILGDKISEQSQKTFVEPISALTISPLKPSANFASFVVLGFWSTHEVNVFALPNFELKGKPVSLPHLPRSLLLYDFGDKSSDPHPHLMVGLADGSVFSFPFAKGKLEEKKVVALGGSPVFLSSCSIDGKPAILASGTRSVLFYWTKDTLGHSPILLKDVLTSSSFNSSTFSASIVLSTPDGLVIGRILELDKLHVRTISMGMDNPVKVSYHSVANLFGIGCVQQEPRESTDLGKTRSSFKLLNAVDFTTTHDYALEPYEEVTAVATVNLDGQNGCRMLFAIGTMYDDETEREPSRGRILIFAPDQNKFHHLLASAEACGCVYAMDCVKGKLVAAINTGVVIFSLVSSDDDHEVQLVRLTEWNHNYLVTSVVVLEDQIVTGDAISSLAVLRLVGQGLVTVARDYSPLWPLCIELVDQRTIIGANSENNLFSFKIQSQGEKKLLEQDGGYNIDETVNKLIRGKRTSLSLNFNPTHLLFTATGRIAVIVDVSDDLSLLLSRLQGIWQTVFMAPEIRITRSKWRAPCNSRGRSDAQPASYGFLDGDLLERFLDYPASSPDIVRFLSGRNDAERLSTPYGQLRSVMESLRSTH
ncbi:mono-functional DNA-alkylating methyl methanesulfonate N-term-domain-containing protein, partial [Phellopilus nigrolimitatus]